MPGEHCRSRGRSEDSPGRWAPPKQHRGDRRRLRFWGPRLVPSRRQLAPCQRPLASAARRVGKNLSPTSVSQKGSFGIVRGQDLFRNQHRPNSRWVLPGLRGLKGRVPPGWELRRRQLRPAAGVQRGPRGCAQPPRPPRPPGFFRKMPRKITPLECVLPPVGRGAGAES